MRSIFQKNPLPIFLLVLVMAATGFLFWKRSTRKVHSDVVARQKLAETSHDQQFQKFNLSGFDDRGKKSWNLEGDTAKVDIGQEVFLDKNVTLRLQDQTIIRTEKVTWSQDAGTFRTNAPVFVDHQSVKVRGIGAYGRPGENYVQLHRNIDMVINSTTTLTCDGPMKIFYDDNKMFFYRNVVVKDAKGTLKSKRMDVFFDPEEKKIERVVAVGDVFTDRGGDTTKSQRAIYTVATGAVRLEGSPEVILQRKKMDGL